MSFQGTVTQCNIERDVHTPTRLFKYRDGRRRKVLIERTGKLLHHVSPPRGPVMSLNHFREKYPKTNNLELPPPNLVVGSLNGRGRSRTYYEVIFVRIDDAVYI